MGLGTCRLRANVVNEEAAGTPSSRAATAPHRQALSWTIRSGRSLRRSVSTAGSMWTAVLASASIHESGVGGSGKGWSPPGYRYTLAPVASISSRNAGDVWYVTV